MYAYLNGIIKDIESNYIVLDINGIGYLIYVANPYYYQIEKNHLDEDMVVKCTAVNIQRLAYCVNFIFSIKTKIRQCFYNTFIFSD